MKQSKKSFESILQELDTVLNKMSDEGTSLEESIELYAKAAALIQEANSTLMSAKVQIAEIDQKLQEFYEAE